jgi:hypothetical protein
MGACIPGIGGGDLAQMQGRWGKNDLWDLFGEKQYKMLQSDIIQAIALNKTQILEKNVPQENTLPL